MTIQWNLSFPLEGEIPTPTYFSFPTMITIIVLSIAAFFGVGAYTAFRYAAKLMNKEVISKEVCENVLDNAVGNPCLAMEYLENGVILPDVEPVQTGQFSGMEVPTFFLREHRHRRLPSSKRLRQSYMQCVVAEVKAKVGTPTDTCANRQVCRRIARSLMESHGLRPTRQAAALPLIVECVMTPSDEEMFAKVFARSMEVTNRRGHFSWMSWICGFANPVYTTRM